MVGMLIGLTLGSKKQREVMLIYMAMFGTYHLVFDSLANIKNPSGRKGKNHNNYTYLSCGNRTKICKVLIESIVIV